MVNSRLTSRRGFDYRSSPAALRISGGSAENPESAGMMLRDAHKRTLSSKRKLSPLAGAALCSSFLVFFATPSSANTLGTLSIPSANVPAADTDGDASAAMLNTASLKAAVVANRTVKMLPGDTLTSLLAREGISEDQRGAAVKALSDLFDASTLKAGDAVEFSMRAAADASAAQLVALHVITGSAQDLTIVAGSDGVFHPIGKHFAQTPDRKWSVVVTERKGTIKHALMADLVSAHVPQNVADDVAAAFTYDPDIPAHPAKGSVFNVVYETASAGRAVRAEHVLRYASLSVDGQEHRVYRYETKQGTVAFMEENGRGVTPLHLASPVRDARMTSPWGWRVHPVLKVRKFHKGVDFAAPKGTPVYAAEDGVIETMGWRGNYGRYVKLDHNERVATAYAHLAGFAKGLHRGSKVNRGDVIAYIGASGLATGNHLYYEVLVDNKQVDPLRPDIMVQVNLDGSALIQFKTYVAQVSQETTQP
jgi:murein DD-endopeptidase MepM/ murein hydrolase activator NlpD